MSEGLSEKHLATHAAAMMVEISMAPYVPPSSWPVGGASLVGGPVGMISVSKRLVERPVWATTYVLVCRRLRGQKTPVIK